MTKEQRSPAANRAPVRTLKLVIAYDGADFHGWQRQAGVRTVQEDLETVARRVLREPVHVIGASRTDAGVHALGQAAHVTTAATIPTRNVFRAISHRLPSDVTLVSVREAPIAFHAIRDARTKLYRYRIHQASRRPVVKFTQRYAWHVWWSLDLDQLRDAARRLCGTHDFASFASAGSPRQSTVRTVRRVDVSRRFDEIRIDVVGDGFLYNQVRNMVGTLIEVGRGHWAAARIDEILRARDRRAAGPTAPPEGLCLRWIRYPADAAIAARSAASRPSEDADSNETA